MRDALRQHWPEYLMEAAGLAALMIAICGFATLLFYPASPLVTALPSVVWRRVLMALTIGLTVLAIIYSPWGKQSGAHINPALTLAFLRLGKVAPWDAVFYIGAQFVGSVLGVKAAAALLGPRLADPTVNYVVTIPGPRGPMVAFAAEAAISFLLMLIVLTASNSTRLARLTGLFVAVLVAAYIFFEAPLSGMSINPARTLGSALPAHLWTGLWVYFTAPPLGMLLAAEVTMYRKQIHNGCAKLHHHNEKRCIFCEFHAR